MNHTEKIPERKAVVINVQKYNVYDGPGIRTLFFFKGCPLRCKWCANPEGMRREPQVMVRRDLCVNCGGCVEVCPQGIHRRSPGTLRHRVDRSIQCAGCRKCAEACPVRAIEIAGEEKTVSELLEIAREDQAFYDSSGGGVTLGGGEVTSQPEAALSLLQACKRAGIHTAIETCGYTRRENLLRLAEFTDLFLYDIKHIDSVQHHKWTGVHNERILDNLTALLQSRYTVKVRMPLIGGVNDKPEDIEGVARFLLPYRELRNFKGIDLLPYHRLGGAKYQQLDMDYIFDQELGVSEGKLVRIEGQLREYGFQVRTIRH